MDFHVPSGLLLLPFRAFPPPLPSRLSRSARVAPMKAASTVACGRGAPGLCVGGSRSGEAE
jgi:hypothetical protein